jgi:hypothetical protein
MLRSTQIKHKEEEERQQPSFEWQNPPDNIDFTTPYQHIQKWRESAKLHNNASLVLISVAWNISTVDFKVSQNDRRCSI